MFSYVIEWSRSSGFPFSDLSASRSHSSTVGAENAASFIFATSLISPSPFASFFKKETAFVFRRLLPTWSRQRPEMSHTKRADALPWEKTGSMFIVVHRLILGNEQKGEEWDKTLWELFCFTKNVCEPKKVSEPFLNWYSQRFHNLIPVAEWGIAFFISQFEKLGWFCSIGMVKKLSFTSLPCKKGVSLLSRHPRKLVT